MPRLVVSAEADEPHFLQAQQNHRLQHRLIRWLTKQFLLSELPNSNKATKYSTSKLNRRLYGTIYITNGVTNVARRMTNVARRMTDVARCMLDRSPYTATCN